MRDELRRHLLRRPGIYGALCELHGHALFQRVWIVMRRLFVCLGCAAVAAGLFIGVVWIGKSGGVQGETCFRRGEVMIRQGTPFGSTAGGGEALE